MTKSVTDLDSAVQTESGNASNSFFFSWPKTAKQGRGKPSTLEVKKIFGPILTNKVSIPTNWTVRK
jgi:hypothetical protein